MEDEVLDARERKVGLAGRGRWLGERRREGGQLRRNEIMTTLSRQVRPQPSASIPFRFSPFSSILLYRVAE